MAFISTCLKSGMIPIGFSAGNRPRKLSSLQPGVRGVEVPFPAWRDVMKRQVEIYDTTLRDGSQGEGINFSVTDKLRIAERIDAFGIHYIDGGWPGSNPKDIEFFEQARRRKWT